MLLYWIQEVWLDDSGGGCITRLSEHRFNFQYTMNATSYSTALIIQSDTYNVTEKHGLGRKFRAR